jgi:hypothetical protein
MLEQEVRAVQVGLGLLIQQAEEVRVVILEQAAMALSIFLTVLRVQVGVGVEEVRPVAIQTEIL